MPTKDAAGPGPQVECARCGRSEVGPPISWMYEHEARRGGQWYCLACARENLRSLEARLDQEWW